MIFLCVLSESLGPTYEREHLYFEHWCNSLNTDFSLHPFSCKSHDFIFLRQETSHGMLMPHPPFLGLGT